MKTIYELNEKDIVSVVAERFEIGTECVHISYDNVAAGYGVAETKYLEQIENEIPDLAKRYFDMKWQ